MYTVRCETEEDATWTRMALQVSDFPFKTVTSMNLRNAAQFTCVNDPSATLRRYGLRVFGTKYELRSVVRHAARSVNYE